MADNALDLIKSHAELGLFAAAVQSSGLVDYLSNPEQRVTVFAVSDDAFASLSATQRDALFNDPALLETLVKATTVPDKRILQSAAGIVDDLETLENGELNFERNGDLITLSSTGQFIDGLLRDEVEVTDTLVSEESAVHVIDDFINVVGTFIPPDSGSIMEGLLAEGINSFASMLRLSRWYRELGNSEKEWTVFAPTDGTSWPLTM